MQLKMAGSILGCLSKRSFVKNASRCQRRVCPHFLSFSVFIGHLIILSEHTQATSSLDPSRTSSHTRLVQDPASTCVTSRTPCVAPSPEAESTCPLQTVSFVVDDASSASLLRVGSRTLQMLLACPDKVFGQRFLFSDGLPRAFQASRVIETIEARFAAWC
jgi:hypothetical protein